MRPSNNLILVLMLVAAAFAQTPPMIDFHMHADSVAAFGSMGIKACPGDVARTWPAANRGSRSLTIDSLEDCPNPIFAAMTDEEAFENTRKVMEKYNITSVVSGPEDYVRKWAAALGNRVIPGICIHKPGEPTIGRLRALIENRQVRVMGEVLLNTPESHRPIWKPAEENDIPVGVHIGPGPAGDWYLPRKEFHYYLRRLVDAGFGSRILCWQVTGVDLSPVAVGRAREAAAARRLTV